MNINNNNAYMHKKNVGFIMKILYNENLSLPTAPVFLREESNLYYNTI